MKPILTTLFALVLAFSVFSQERVKVNWKETNNEDVVYIEQK